MAISKSFCCASLGSYVRVTNLPVHGEWPALRLFGPIYHVSVVVNGYNTVQTEGAAQRMFEITCVQKDFL